MFRDPMEGKEHQITWQWKVLLSKMSKWWVDHVSKRFSYIPTQICMINRDMLQLALQWAGAVKPSGLPDTLQTWTPSNQHHLRLLGNKTTTPHNFFPWARVTRQQLERLREEMSSYYAADILLSFCRGLLPCSPLTPAFQHCYLASPYTWRQGSLQGNTYWPHGISLSEYPNLNF